MKSMFRRVSGWDSHDWTRSKRKNNIDIADCTICLPVTVDLLSHPDHIPLRLDSLNSICGFISYPLSQITILLRVTFMLHRTVLLQTETRHLRSDAVKFTSVYGVIYIQKAHVTVFNWSLCLIYDQYNYKKNTFIATTSIKTVNKRNFFSETLIVAN